MPKAVEKEVIIEAFVQEISSKSFFGFWNQVFRPSEAQKSESCHDRVCSEGKKMGRRKKFILF